MKPPKMYSCSGSKILTLFITVFLFFLGSCSTFKGGEKSSDSPTTRPPDQILEDNMKQFERLFDVEIDNLEALWVSDGTIGGDNAAVCYQSHRNTRIVYISDMYKSKPTLTQLILYHELGHCVFGFDHKTARIAHRGERIPFSIMNRGLFSAEIYRNHRSYYIAQMRSMIQAKRNKKNDHSE